MSEVACLTTERFHEARDLMLELYNSYKAEDKRNMALKLGIGGLNNPMGNMVEKIHNTATFAKFGAELAKESARNEKIAKKILKAKSRAYAYAPQEPMRTHSHDLGVTS
ncbi:hypothetical protein PIB30_043145 [Stylosanthes scabra]|uniref:Uncharacterized protein n=1 Tax=Stylosanthes scabra TaxID=79078 RepID=A0ABU6YEC2_9FABA|nr:hypothetical protein [Stylosanthes scabra]